MVAKKVFKEKMRRMDATRHLAWKSPLIRGTAGSGSELGMRKVGKRRGSMMSYDHGGWTVWRLVSHRNGMGYSL